MAIGKHTGTGRLLYHDKGTGALLYDPSSGRLLYDGDVWFQDDPPEDGEYSLPGSWTGYLPLRAVWRLSYDLRSGDAGFGYAYKDDQGVEHDQTGRVAAWLDSFYGDGVPSSGTAGTDTSSYAWVSCGKWSTEARLRAAAACLSPDTASFWLEGNPVYDSATVHYYRLPVYCSGDYSSNVARFRRWDADPGSGFHGGSVFARLGRNGRTRVLHLADGGTYGFAPSGPRDIPACVTADIRATGLPFVAGSGIGGLGYTIPGVTTALNPSRHVCAYVTIRYHYT